MVQEYALAELHTIAEIADKRSQNTNVVQLPAKQLFKIRDIAGIIGQGRIGLCAQRPRPHHFLYGFFEIRFPVVCRPTLIHQFIDIALFVIHMAASSQQTVCTQPAPDSLR